MRLRSYDQAGREGRMEGEREGNRGPLVLGESEGKEEGWRGGRRSNMEIYPLSLDRNRVALNGHRGDRQR